MSAISMGFSLPASGLAEAVRRRQLLKEGQRPGTDRERLIPLGAVSTAALSPGEAQPSAGMGRGKKGHCSLLPLPSPSETLCSVAFMLAERFPEEHLGCEAALGWC